MYPVKLGFSEANIRIKKLISDDYCAEALVTSMFTVEKTLRRTLRQIIISAGFTSSIADRLLKKFGGLVALKENWDIYDPHNKKLVGRIILEEDWEIVKQGNDMRNQLVHGLRVYQKTTCKSQTLKILEALTNIETQFDSVYGYSGWVRGKSRRRSMLHTDPKVNI